MDWLIGLKMATEEDWKTVDEEENTVIDEERKKRGLIDGETFLDWRDSGRFNKDEERDDQTSEESASGSEGPTETKAREENVDEDIVALDWQSPSPELEISPPLPLPEPSQAPHSDDYDTLHHLH